MVTPLKKPLYYIISSATQNFLFSRPNILRSITVSQLANLCIYQMKYNDLDQIQSNCLKLSVGLQTDQIQSIEFDSYQEREKFFRMHAKLIQKFLLSISSSLDSQLSQIDYAGRCPLLHSVHGIILLQSNCFQTIYSVLPLSSFIFQWPSLAVPCFCLAEHSYMVNSPGPESERVMLFYSK